MFNSMWSSLIKQNNFLTSMLTPIIKAKKKNKVIQFYNLTDYDNWKNSTDSRKWDIKYYKGLGTSTTTEAKEYFKDMKQVFYEWNDEDKCKESLDLAFNKKRADDRKQWLYNYNRNEIIDYKETRVSYSDFIDKELIHFSNYNIERSIPSLCDGLKTSTRKILYCCFKKNLTKEIKVSQLSGYCSENSNYHHGEVSLQEAIIKMAQNFVGSNNINLLMPNGQFGSRLAAKDSASPRYIFTELNPLTLLLFNKNDNKILKYLDDDGFPIEPQFYIPILPVILINGSIGIATGFSTNIPSYNPLDIIKVIKKMLKNKTANIEVEELIPWYRGFTGKIIKVNNKLMSLGIYKRISPNKIQITELPVGFWTNDYKEFLEKYMDKNPKILKDFESHYTESTVNFILDFYDGKTNDLLKPDTKTGLTKFEKEFKLFSSDNFSTTNMHMYNDEGKIIKCDTAIEIIRLFYNVRIKYYQMRKDYMIDELNKELIYLDAKIKFILDIINKKLIVTDRKKVDIENYLIENKYPTLDDKYDYLIRMPIYNLTYEKKEELLKEVNDKKELLEEITNISIEDMWLNDLNEFEKQYKQVYK